MSSDDQGLRLTPELVQQHARLVDVNTLEPWPANPVDFDIGAATVYSTMFGQTDVVVTYGTQVLIGTAQVQAEKTQPEDNSQTLAVDLQQLGWTLEQAEAGALGKLTQHRLALWDDQTTADLTLRLHDYNPDYTQAAGWDDDAINQLLEDLGAPPFVGEEPEEPPVDPVTKLGDVWLLGPHRLVCGDSTEYPPPAEAVITDPPYGVKEKTKRKTSGRGTSDATSINVGDIRAKEFEPVIGDDRPFDPSPWLDYPKVVLFGANHYCDRLPPSPTWIVWDKLNGLETDKRDWGFDDNADAELAWSNLGGPVRTFSHRWKGLLKDSERQESRVHPTQKPVELFAWLIRRATEKGDVVLDPYAGSGACLMACEQENRVSTSFELSPAYCDVICRRYQQTTGTTPILESTNQPHNFT